MSFSTYFLIFICDLLEWEEASGKLDGNAKDLAIAYEAEAESKLQLFDTFISPVMWMLPEVSVEFQTEP